MEALIWAEEEEKWFVYPKRSCLPFTSALNVANIQSMLKYFRAENVLKCVVGVVG
jgi:hypothetical protein